MEVLDLSILVEMISELLQMLSDIIQEAFGSWNAARSISRPDFISIHNSKANLKLQV